MSKGSAKSSRLPGRDRLKRRISPVLLRRAASIVSGYRVVLEPREGAGYVGYSVELPGVMAGGSTPAECAEATVTAQTGMVATMLEAGERPPSPSSESKRGSQVNLRVTLEEKLVLESAAKRQGFRGVSEFLRTAGLRAVERD
jgi:predicted RNase H-like HicB family nuclease